MATRYDYLPKADDLGYPRMLQSEDGAVVYEITEGILAVIDTLTDKTYFSPMQYQGDDELALSGDGRTLTASEYLLDTDLGLHSYLTQTAYEGVGVTQLLGEKLSPDGSLLFAPLSDGLDIYDARSGNWRGRMGTSVTLANAFDSLVSDSKTSTLVAITTDGVAVFDLATVPLPPPAALSVLTPAHQSTRREITSDDLSIVRAKSNSGRRAQKPRKLF